MDSSISSLWVIWAITSATRWSTVAEEPTHGQAALAFGMAGAVGEAAVPAVVVPKAAAVGRIRADMPYRDLERTGPSPAILPPRGANLLFQNGFVQIAMELPGRVRTCKGSVNAVLAGLLKRAGTGARAVLTVGDGTPNVCGCDR